MKSWITRTPKRRMKWMKPSIIVSIFCGPSKDLTRFFVHTVLKTAGHHMEYTMKASYTGIVIGNIIKTNNYEQLIRKFLRDNKFSDMVVILEKYYNFMNYTASVSIVFCLFVIYLKRLHGALATHLLILLKILFHEF